jgi:MFS family permease
MSLQPAGIASNANRLLWAGFMAILAAGVGFASRNGILDNWASEFGFTDAQNGAIGGAGFNGFCFGIILGGVVVDKIGYGKLVALAFLLHVVSAGITYFAGGESAFTTLYWGAFLFAYANGTLEAVANPLVATLFPGNRTHYLNILHASWPAGMVLGSAMGWLLDDHYEVSWRTQLMIYLVPTAIYGLMFLGQVFPKSATSARGMSLGQMFKDVGILGSAVAFALVALFLASVLGGVPGIGEGATLMGWLIAGALVVIVGLVTKFSFGSIILLALFVTHALVGSVELGTDTWSPNIIGKLFTSEQGKYLFIWTSLIMFSLRFCAHWIERNLKLSPVGLLLVCSILACLGLYLASGMTTFAMALVAMGIYAVGKTFFWPTMLAIASDRFPRTGAVAISFMGGIGMLSAGMIGIPGLGYCIDRFTGESLQAADAAVYQEYKAPKPSYFLQIASTETYGLDGTKREEAFKVAPDLRTAAQQKVVDASMAGTRQTFRVDAYIPAAMACIYLLLLLYFKAIGGYRPITIEEAEKQG